MSIVYNYDCANHELRIIYYNEPFKHDVKYMYKYPICRRK